MDGRDIVANQDHRRDAWLDWKWDNSDRGDLNEDDLREAFMAGWDAAKDEASCAG